MPEEPQLEPIDGLVVWLLPRECSWAARVIGAPKAEYEVLIGTQHLAIIVEPQPGGKWYVNGYPNYAVDSPVAAVDLALRIRGYREWQQGRAAC